MAIEVSDSFGQLTVIATVGKRAYGGRETPFYLCRCTCGREEELPRNRLIKRTSCAVCMRGNCVVCGKPIERKTNALTCSDACQTLKKRNKWNLDYSRRFEQNPELNKDMYRRKMERLKDNPDELQAFKERESVRKSISRSVNQKQEKAAAAKSWKKNKEALKKRRKEFWESLTPDERDQRRDRKRELERIRAENYRNTHTMTPEERLTYNAKQREYYRQRQQDNAFSELRNLTQKLQEKLTNEHSNPTPEKNTDS